MTNWHLQDTLTKSRMRPQATESLDQADRRHPRGLAVAGPMVLLILLGLPAGCRRNAGPAARNAAPVPTLKLYPIVVGGNGGLINARGEIVVEPRFEAISFNRSGSALIPAKHQGHWGYIDRTGAFVIDPVFDIAWGFAEGLASVRINGKWGYIDETGSAVIPPQFENAFEFQDGRAAVAIASPGRAGHSTWEKLWGYIDKTGAFVVEPTLHGARNFSDGLAVVRRTHEWEFHYIDKKGRTVAGPFFECWSMSSEMPGMAHVQTYDGHHLREGIIGRDGRYVIEAEHPFLAVAFSEGLIAVGRYAVPHRDGLTIKGYMNRNGELAIPYRYWSALPFSEGRAAVSEDDETWGFIDKAGNYITPPQYEDVWSFRDGLAAVKLGGRWGFIDRDGAMVIEPSFQAVSRGFQDGLAAVNVGGDERPHGPVEGGKWGYINKSGAWVAPPQFTGVSLVWEDGVTLVRVGDKRGYINRQGEYIWEPSE